MTFFSTTITPTSAIQNVMTNKIGIRRVKQILIRIRSLGDATLINVGGSDTQDVQLTAVGDAIGMDTPFGQRYLDVRKLFITSDGTTPVVEIFGDTYEGKE